MRGIVSLKLKDFLTQVNQSIADAKQNNVLLTPMLLRENLNKLSAFMSKSHFVEYVTDKKLELENRIIPVRIYSPDPNTALPVMIHFHGGGHVCGSIELYDPICRHLASIAQCVVISVDYRLAPEHPYPAGINDCEYALIHYAQLLGDVKHQDSVTIIGDSAGGAICTTLSMNSLSNPAIKIDKQILIYPSVDYTMSQPSVSSNGTGFLIEQSRIKWYFKQYFQKDSQNDQLLKRASPLFGKMSSKLPETLIFTAGCDPLRDEGDVYAHTLKDYGVTVEHHDYQNMIHAYMLLHDLVEDECLETYHNIAKFMAK